MCSQLSSAVGRDHLCTLGLESRDRVNSKLGGGIPTDSIVLIEGEYGAGKSAFTQRFSHGFCEEGYQTTYLSTELTFSGMLDQMSSLSYDVVPHLLDGQLLFLHADLSTGGILSGADTTAKQTAGDSSGANGASRTSLLERMMHADAMWDSGIILIDTFNAILRNDPHFESLVRDDDGRQAALEIINHFRRITSTGKSIILTVDPTAVGGSVISPFREIADIYLELEMVEVGNDTRRQVKVRRFAGMGEQVGDTIGYSVRQGTGIVIETRSVA